jgi:hypothetical protein
MLYAKLRISSEIIIEISIKLRATASKFGFWPRHVADWLQAIFYGAVINFVLAGCVFNIKPIILNRYGLQQ